MSFVVRVSKWSLLLTCFVVTPADSQCMLADPSFELEGSGAQAFAGWNQFGPVVSTTRAAHGQSAAQVTGPNTANFDVSGVWQNLTCAPGQRWTTSVYVAPSLSAPLLGQSRAILNIEWRNSSGVLISYESHVAADPSAAPGIYRSYEVQSQAAPAGTASIHFLLGVLQGPGDPTPIVYFDQARCENQGPPTLASLQWADFGGGRSVSFAGRSWRVKGPGFFGPGPNSFDNGVNAVSVDASDRLRLTVRKIVNTWYSTEVVLEQPLGYGDYVFTTKGRLDTLHPNVVLGMFLWEYGPCFDTNYLWWNPYNEIDIEYSRWGNPGNANTQFVAQPYDYSGNITRFSTTFTDSSVTSHAMRWLSDRVEYRVWRGGPNDESATTRIASWTYRGPHVPRPESPRVHLNLWQATGPPTTNQEVIFQSFVFRSACPNGDCAILDAPPASTGPPVVSTRAWPSPFSGSIRIAFTMAREAEATVTVLDAAGRRVRALSGGGQPAGVHELTWDGRDDSGQQARPGLYFVRIQQGAESQTRRIIRLD